MKGGFEVAVAERDGRVVGFIVFKRERGYVDIDNLDVRRDEQGKGVGRALVAHVEGVARECGFSLVRTDTTENAQGVPWKSYGFWIRMGFRDTGERLRTEYDFKTIPFIKNL